jgi:ubiquitin-conjugating enzyme E2 R
MMTSILCSVANNVVLQTDNINIQKWRFALMVINTDSAFNGGYFKVR